MTEMKNKDLDPTTDIELTLGYTSHCIQRNLNGASGAGVNAVSTLNLALAATEPLAEIVWSPRKGLSLRCADYSFFSKKSSHFWDAAPSIMVLSPQQGTDRVTDECNLLRAQNTFHANSEIPEAEPLARSSGSDLGNIHRPSKERGVRDTNLDKLSGGGNSHVMETVKTRESNDLDMLGQGNEGAANVVSSSKEFNGADDRGGTDVSLGNHRMGGTVELTFEIDHGNNCNAQSLDINLEDSVSVEKEANNRMEKVDITNTRPLERLESTDENDLQALNLDAVLDVASKNLVASGSCQEPKNYSQQNTKQCHEDKLTRNRVKMDQKKLKEKLYDEEASKRASREDNESHGSVESCNSAGLFSSGKKRCNFEEQLIDGSKRVKRHIGDSPSSSGYRKNDSSFMNWISNVVKGFTKVVEDEAPNLALTIQHHDNRHEVPNEKPREHDIKNNHGRQNTGFQSVFQSLYSPNSTSLEVGNAHTSYAGEGSKNLELVNNVCEVGATPLACHGGVICQSIVPMRKCDESTGGSGAALFTRQEGPGHAFILENSGVKSAENKITDRLVFPNEKNVSTSSSDNPEVKNASNFNLNLIAESKRTHNSGKRSNLLSSLWVKRFSPHCSGPLPSHNHLDEDTSLDLNFPAYCSRFVPHSHDHVGDCEDHVLEEMKEKTTNEPPALVNKKLQNGGASAEDSVDFGTARGYNSSKSIQNFNLFLPSPREKTSEAMACTFARRLDALRHISTLDETQEASANMTCFFCGAEGHHLQNCPVVPGSEVKGFSRNISSCNNAEKSPSYRIKSFQPNHWPVTGNLPSTGKRKLEYGALMDRNHPSEIPLDLDDSYIKIDERRECMSMEADAHTTYHDIYIRMQKRESCAMVVSNRAIQSEEFIASSSKGKQLDENKLLTFANPASRPNTHVPEEMFELVKQLRLSRTTILNLSLISSHISTSCLNGFFLRLRLGKWEAGLGGTGYYVAFITGVEGEEQTDGTKNRISVNIGGINCLVESQYISNNDFLQEELTAWWHATLRSGGHIPSEEELRIKVEERKRLGV